MNLRKTRLYIAMICFFLALSFLFVSPGAKKQRSQFHSSQLHKSTVAYENTERTDYTDDAGQITIAADLGYATLIKTRTTSGILEQYLDEQGEPISRYNGYYALLQEYDDRGNNVRTTYLDADGKPMIMANGYAIEEKKYNESRQFISVRYYDAGGKPISTALYGYGKNNEYNENNQISRITYVDASGDPMITGLGYAGITQNYYATEGPENGRTESEFYFDDAGVPISLSLGQYGVHAEYDEYGRKSVLTYLDVNGEPIATNKGYATVVRTYHANGNTATERYYDLSGQPYALPEGQYGIRNDSGRTVYLDQNGNELFNLKNLLYNHSWVIIPAALIVILLSGLAGRKWIFLFLTAYVCVICYLTLMFRDGNHFNHAQFLWYYRKIFTDREARADVLKNIWLFIPLGGLLYRLFPKKTVLLIPAALSLLIEGIQYFSGTGFSELDDVISNSLGGGIGFCMGRMTAEIRTQFIHRKQTHIM